MYVFVYGSCLFEHNVYGSNSYNNLDRIYVIHIQRTARGHIPAGYPQVECQFLEKKARRYGFGFVFREKYFKTIRKPMQRFRIGLRTKSDHSL